MKYYRITLNKAHPNAPLEYPSGINSYQENIGNFAKDHLYYEEDGVTKLLLTVEDESVVGKTIVQKDVEELTEQEAKAVSEANESRTETITDEAKIRRIEIKSRLRVALTEDEEKAIDPEDETSGFNKSKILADRIEDLKTVETAKKTLKESSK